MKKLFLILGSLVLILTLGLFFIRNYFQIGINTIVERVTPANKEIENFLPQGSDLNYPLKIPEGFRLSVFADLGGGLPRVLTFDPKGTLVTSVPNKGKVIALPDDNRDGKADRQVELLAGLNNPHGIAFYKGRLFVAEEDKVSSWNYDPETFSVLNKQILFSLPSGGRHFTRTIKIRNDKIYVSVGSSCDTCIEKNPFRGAILVSDIKGNDLKVFAKGLRNTVFFVFDEEGRIWGNDMGRDFLGDDLPPDELNLIEEGKDYGWPYCYGDKVRDTKFKNGEFPDYCSDTEAPIFNYPAHVAPLGIVFIKSNAFPASDQGSLLVAYHGSWNRSVPVGYKIVKIPIFGDSVGEAEDFITGWYQKGKVLGRPVDLVFDDEGNLFISDDRAGLIYKLERSF